MRKRQPLADAQALSMQLSLIEAALLDKRLTLEDVDKIDAVVDLVRMLEGGKIIIAPPLLRRVKVLATVARRFRAIRVEAQEEDR